MTKKTSKSVAKKTRVSKKSTKRPSKASKTKVPKNRVSKKRKERSTNVSVKGTSSKSTRKDANMFSKEEKKKYHDFIIDTFQNNVKFMKISKPLWKENKNYRIRGAINFLNSTYVPRIRKMKVPKKRKVHKDITKLAAWLMVLRDYVGCFQKNKFVPIPKRGTEQHALCVEKKKEYIEKIRSGEMEIDESLLHSNSSVGAQNDEDYKLLCELDEVELKKLSKIQNSINLEKKQNKKIRDVLKHVGSKDRNDFKRVKDLEKIVTLCKKLYDHKVDEYLTVGEGSSDSSPMESQPREVSGGVTGSFSDMPTNRFALDSSQRSNVAIAA